MGEVSVLDSVFFQFVFQGCGIIYYNISRKGNTN